jgi:hypothetical protein
MNQAVKEISPYLNEFKYIKFKIKITKIRTKINTYDFYKFYNRQNGICEFCNQSITFKNINKKPKPEKLEIHHIKTLFIKKRQSNYNNKSLLHKSCHSIIHKNFKKN